MNSKDIKKYSLISQITNAQPQDEKLKGLFAELAAIDFAVAFEVWEYLLTANQKELEDIKTCANLESRIFTLFNSISESRTRQLFTDSLPLTKLVYTQCASSCSGTNLNFIANLILSTKIEAAEEILRCVKANATAGFDFGEKMKDVLDCVFATYCAGKGVKKCELNKKQSTLLLEYISKIKGPNKLLLTQRIKEL